MSYENMRHQAEASPTGGLTELLMLIGQLDALVGEEAQAVESLMACLALAPLAWPDDRLVQVGAGGRDPTPPRHIDRIGDLSERVRVIIATVQNTIRTANYIGARIG